MDNSFCPLIQKKCIEHKCKFYSHVIGLHPQTGQPVDEYNCAISMLPMLLIENANETRKNSASVDKVANEVRGIANTPINISLQLPKPTNPNLVEIEETKPQELENKSVDPVNTNQ